MHFSFLYLRNGIRENCSNVRHALGLDNLFLAYILSNAMNGFTITIIKKKKKNMQSIVIQSGPSCTRKALSGSTL